MFRQITTAIFFIAFGAFTFSKAVIVVEFYANQKSIAANLCINKARPAMHCNGKCQLSEKMTKDSAKDKQNPDRKNETKNEVFTATLTVAANRLHAGSRTKFYPSFIEAKSTDRAFDIFHPPLG